MISETAQTFQADASSKVSNSEILAQIAISQALEMKATQPICLDLRHLNVLSDYFVIVSASNTRQSVAIAESIRIFVKQNLGLHPLGVDGFESGNWILLDYGAVFIHVFVDETRQVYQLEQLWSKGRPVELLTDSAAFLAQHTLPKPS